MLPLELQKDTVNLIKAINRVLIVPSTPVDGDSLGSAIALYLVLKKLGKEATVVCTDIIPTVYNFLPGISLIQNQFHFVQDLVVTIDCRNLEIADVKPDIQKDRVNIIITPKRGKLDPSLVSLSRGEANFDSIITVDAGSVEQFKTVYETNTEMWSLLPVINIDHHVSNENFGKINAVDVMASSTTVIVLNIIDQLGADLIDPDTATLLLAGLIVDTGSFQNPNTTPDAFSIAARLIELGARQQEIIQHIYKTKKLSTLKLWGRVLSKLQFDQTHKLVWSTIAQKDFTDTQSSPEESEGLIDELMSNAPGTDIVLLLKDRGDGLVSGSVRTTSPAVSANLLAEKFGGGGHLQAAGFKIAGKILEEVEPAVISAFRQFQEKRLHLASEQMQVQKPFEVEPAMPAPQNYTQAPVLTNLMNEQKSAASDDQPPSFPTPLDMV